MCITATCSGIEQQFDCEAGHRADSMAPTIQFDFIGPRHKAGALGWLRRLNASRNVEVHLTGLFGKLEPMPDRLQPVPRRGCWLARKRSSNVLSDHRADAGLPIAATARRLGVGKLIENAPPCRPRCRRQ